MRQNFADPRSLEQIHHFDQNLDLCLLRHYDIIIENQINIKNFQISRGEEESELISKGLKNLRAQFSLRNLFRDDLARPKTSERCIAMDALERFKALPNWPSVSNL